MADPSSSNMREYRKGNWTVTETLVLIEAKKMDEERRVRPSTGLPPEKQPNRPSELRWKWIEEYCWKKGCLRNQNQCNDKWDNLMRDYKKIREYERWRVESSFSTAASSSSSPATPYWKMEKGERKEKSLPSNMLSQIYERLSELVEKKSLPSSSSASAAGAVVGNGSYSGGQIFNVCKQSLGPMIAQPLHQIQATTIVLPLPPPPPPPSRQQPLVLSQPPLFQTPPSTFHVEPIQQPIVDTSPAKRRRTTPGETTAGGDGEAEEVAVGAALSRSASVIAQVMKESDERQEMRHKEMVMMQERRLKIEESKAEVNRQGMNGLVDAISKLATSIHALASSSSSTSTCHNNQNHQGSAP
ncbi:hypothetical protein AALP_AA4G127700 [Arabis alpina]|uniref:Myb-like domain-containing protein n=1 Tax=Arabis alpina TaxID=50452 RepID=A0A087H2V9_ARAAL|nr:hypothetical protein AALP_AA4G127700 [Arabis alpina]